VDAIARHTGEELASARAETKSLVDSLMWELRIIAELPGRYTLSLPGRRRDANAPPGLRPAAERSGPSPMLSICRPSTRDPSVLCAPGSLALEPYLHILQWFREDDETHASSFRRSARRSRPISAIVSGAKTSSRRQWNRTRPKTLVAVTNRRIITARRTPSLSKPEIVRTSGLIRCDTSGQRPRRI